MKRKNEVKRRANSSLIDEVSNVEIITDKEKLSALFGASCADDIASGALHTAVHYKCKEGLVTYIVGSNDKVISYIDQELARKDYYKKKYITYPLGESSRDQ